MGMSDAPTPPRSNVADRLAVAAAVQPDAVAIAVAGKRGGFKTITYAELDADATTLAQGLVAIGVRPGMRMALLVRPGIEFVTLVFALLRSGATMVLVDAGLGRKNIVRCLASTEPEGFVAIPLGHAMRLLKRREFPKAKIHVTVGRRWAWGGETLDSLRRAASAPLSETHRRRELPHTADDDTAAIVFTSGSTGPPKGVLYRHETFVTQADEIQRQYDLQPGGVDLACFPLFGLFNVACGVTTVFPDMDFSRPASCNPHKLLEAANHWKCNQAFGSPAVWDCLSRHCEATGARIPTLRKVFSCGAPVPAKVLRRTLACVHPEAQMHTPYGATESLPVATIEAQEVLNETAAKTDEGAGICVGRKFDTIDWRIIRISDGPITTIEETESLPPGEIGELIVRGPQVSRSYTGEPRASVSRETGTGDNHHNALAKIQDGNTIWHRIGDVGYFDDQQRFWYCGRKSHRVETTEGTLFTIPIESIANTHHRVERSALVGIGPRGDQRPVLVIERRPVRGPSADVTNEVATMCSKIMKVILYPRKLPVDIRHNSKIRREKLAVWAAEQLPRLKPPATDADGSPSKKSDNSFN